MNFSARFRNVLIRPDQTISQVANKYYGDPTRWRDILDANPDFPFLENRVENIIILVPLDTRETTNTTSSIDATNILFNTTN